MAYDVTLMQAADAQEWDAYVNSHPHAILYHRCEWKKVIEKSYRHKGYYLMAINRDGVHFPSDKTCLAAGDAEQTGARISAQCDFQKDRQNRAFREEKGKKQIAGILPLFHLKSFLFGNNLVSLPFFDLGGVLADNQEAEEALLREAVGLAKGLGADTMELRHIEPLSSLSSRCSNFEPNPSGPQDAKGPTSFAQDEQPVWVTRSHKVRMVLDLPDSPDELMKSFKAKLRSQIKKPMKEGLESRIGGLELIDDFYAVFCANMRDVGSPVHGKNLIKNVLRGFREEAKIIIVHKAERPLACSLVIGFKKTLENPWASSLKDYATLSPNMLLYWTMLEYACKNGFTCFDFGRSSPDEGTYKFKEQWGAKGHPLYWHYINLYGRKVNLDSFGTEKYQRAIQCWSKLPLPAANAIGPFIRRYISL